MFYLKEVFNKYLSHLAIPNGDLSYHRKISTAKKVISVWDCWKPKEKAFHGFERKQVRLFKT